jgi:metal-responsive CopG/Arc/MetJ family transcriptional regulator
MQKIKHKRWNPVMVSLPDEQVHAIDDLRNDVTRSKYIQRIIQNHLEMMKMSMEIC